MCNRSQFMYYRCCNQHTISTKIRIVITSGISGAGGRFGANIRAGLLGEVLGRHTGRLSLNSAGKCASFRGRCGSNRCSIFRSSYIRLRNLSCLSDAPKQQVTRREIITFSTKVKSTVLIEHILELVPGILKIFFT